MAKILIIEDDPVISRMYQRVLKLSSHVAEIAEDGEVGLEMVRAVTYDLIVLDIMMPKVNGLDVLKQLKAHQETALVPVVILTNSVSDKVIKAAMAMGAARYLLKSDHDPMEVVEIVEDVLRSKKS